MPAQSKPTQHQHHHRRRTRRASDPRPKPAVRGLGDCSPKPPTKHGYSPDVFLTDDQPPCAPDLPFPAFTPAVLGNCQLPTFFEHHDFFPASEHPPTKRTNTTSTTAETAETAASFSSSYYKAAPSGSFRTTRADLNRLSTREYALRASDESDFAWAWERSLAPLLTDLIQRHCSCDFAVDVHNFPEVSGDAVPRVIFITLNDSEGGADTSGLEATLRSEVARAVPERFRPVCVKFRRGGGLRRANWWWGGGASADGDDGRDWVCEPKNVTYRATPVMGMSIGPVNTQNAAASLGGFVRVGSDVYAMSASHVFEDAVRALQTRVCHPAEPDLARIVPQDPKAKQYPIGAVTMSAPTGTFRSSLTFRGMRIESENTLVEMDWCLIGPVRNGVNVLPVPSFRMNQCVRVETTARVEGNTEVYAMARTSGYSLGYTSDVPGVQKISGRMRREWTVRQYTPFNNPDDTRTRAPWQTLKQWVTSGIGVPGDSGAWLMRRSDNGLIGLIWGRNHARGDPRERIRLTYFTPMVDILAEIEEKHARGDEVALPVHQGQSTPEVEVRRQRRGVSVDMSHGPWSVFSREAIRDHHQVQANLIQNHFADGRIPRSGTVLDRHPGAEESLRPHNPSTIRSATAEPTGTSVLVADPPTTPPRNHNDGWIPRMHPRDRMLAELELNPNPGAPLPELAASASTLSSPSLADEVSEVISAGSHVHITDENDNDIVPVRAKATFTPKPPEPSRANAVFGVMPCLRV